MPSLDDDTRLGLHLIDSIVHDIVAGWTVGDTWNVRAASASDTLPGAHEYAHAQLNLTTPFGRLLILLATAYEHTRAAADHESLAAVTAQCRLTHEMYATSASLSLSEDWGTASDNFRASYPSYGVFLDTSSDVSRRGGVNPGSLRGHLLNATVAYVAMGADVLAIYADHEVAQPLVHQIPRGHRPDVRMRILCQLEPSTWRSIVDTADGDASDLLESALVAIDDGSGRNNHRIWYPAVDSFWTAYIGRVYSELSVILTDRFGFETCEFNSRSFSSLRRAGDRLNSLAGLELVAPLHNAELVTDHMRTAAHVYNRHRFWLSSRPIPATVEKISHNDVAAMTTNLQSSDGSRVALFLRTAEQLIASYDLDDESLELLSALPEPLVTCRGHNENGSLSHLVIDDLSGFLDAVNAPALLSIPASTLTNKAVRTTIDDRCAIFVFVDVFDADTLAGMIQVTGSTYLWHSHAMRSAEVPTEIQQVVVHDITPGGWTWVILLADYERFFESLLRDALVRHVVDVKFNKEFPEEARYFIYMQTAMLLETESFI